MLKHVETRHLNATVTGPSLAFQQQCTGCSWILDPSEAPNLLDTLQRVRVISARLELKRKPRKFENHHRIQSNPIIIQWILLDLPYMNNIE